MGGGFGGRSETTGAVCHDRDAGYARPRAASEGGSDMSTTNEFPWQEDILRNLQGGASVTVEISPRRWRRATQAPWAATSTIWPIWDRSSVPATRCA